ncbi:putative uncharacterized protein DDB_G0271606 [Acanthaster planci]|uniref:Uncharacterized protein n=1 Tax=Acanthaster planci TaxID=133434 RepID=A0A8B7Y7Y7_ACAPL|nr:putative uncharacterized protein DDB_G0271606 [Acanthaster planci]
MPIKGVLTKPHPRLCDAAALPDGDKQYGSSSEANRDAQLCRQKALDLEREIQVEWQNEHLNIKGLVDTEKRLLDYRQVEKQQDHMQAELLQGQMEMLRQQAEQEHGVSAAELQHRAHLRQEAQLQLLANQQRLAELERQAELNLQAERQRQRLQCQAELHRQVALQQQAHIQRQTELQQQAYIQWHAQVHRAEVERQQLLWQAQLRWQAEQAELERQALMQQQARLQRQAVNESQAWETQRQEEASKQLAEAHRKAEEEAKFQAWVVEAQTRALEIAAEECRRNERLYQLNREREEQAICEGYPARPPVVKPPKTRNKNNNGKVCKKAQSGLTQTHSNDQAEPRAVQPYDRDQLETFIHGPSTPSKKCRPRKKNPGLPSLSKVMLSGKPRRR